MSDEKPQPTQGEIGEKPKDSEKETPPPIKTLPVSKEDLISRTSFNIEDGLTPEMFSPPTEETEEETGPQPGPGEVLADKIRLDAALEIGEAKDSIELVKAVENSLVISRDFNERMRTYSEGFLKAYELGDAPLATQFLLAQQMEKRLLDLTETLTQFMTRLNAQNK